MSPDDAHGGASLHPHGLAEEVVRALTARGETVAVAESLTGGLLGAAITSVPGASAVFRGGVLAYATELKASLLDVDPALLAREGAVHPDVAAQMAHGVATRLGATWGLATTGVAGPDPQDGHPVGEVFVAVAGPGSPVAAARADIAIPDGADPASVRALVRADAVTAALALLAGRLLG
jgi:nicotinamide-nucleotide amidase